MVLQGKVLAHCVRRIAFEQVLVAEVVHAVIEVSPPVASRSGVRVCLEDVEGRVAEPADTLGGEVGAQMVADDVFYLGLEFGRVERIRTAELEELARQPGVAQLQPGLHG